jgi:hypothetical protein
VIRMISCSSGSRRPFMKLDPPNGSVCGCVVRRP